LVSIGVANDARFRAFDAKSGKKLWFAQLEAAGAATLMTLDRDGRKYVVIAGGPGDTDRGGTEQYIRRSSWHSPCLTDTLRLTLILEDPFEYLRLRRGSASRDGLRANQLLAKVPNRRVPRVLWSEGVPPLLAAVVRK
jgi:PQQ enzyme repeat